MDTLSLADNVTVVGGPSGSTYGPKDDLKSPHLRSGTLSDDKVLRGKGVSVANAELVRNIDFITENRPFLIPIDKAGLIAALQKLDRQLQNVRDPTVRVRRKALIPSTVWKG
jgi:hypothetical protein